MRALVDAFCEDERYGQLRELLEEGKLPVHVHAIDKRVRALLMEAIPRKNKKKQRLIIAEDERRAKEIVADYKFYDREVYYYPAKDALFYYADIHSNATAQKRLEIFKALSEGRRITVVCTIEGLMDKIPPLKEMAENIITLEKGGTIKLEELSRQLVNLGYEKTAMVELPGQFSVRGGIIDIYPLTEDCPYRAELWGDEIDSLRSFDAESQRSIEEHDSVAIYPSAEMVLDDDKIAKGLSRIEAELKKQYELLRAEFRTEQSARLKRMVENVKEELKEFNSTMGLDSMVEYFYDDTVSFLDYFDDDIEIFVDEPEKINSHASVYTSEFAMSMEGRLEGGYILPGQAGVLYDGKEIIGRLNQRRTILMSGLYKKQYSWGEASELMFLTNSIMSYNNSFEKLLADLGKWKNKKYRVLIFSPSATRAKRITANLNDNDIAAHFSQSNSRELVNGEIRVCSGRLESGFEIPEARLVVISEGDIFVDKELTKKRKSVKFEKKNVSSFAELVVGDYVVHERHGVGMYRGIEKVETEGRLKDYICIEYAKGSRLFVPVEQLNLIGKLSNKDSGRVKLNKLGGPEWSKVRQNVKGHIDDMAKELVELYAIRQNNKGFAFSQDSEWQREFEELFPYEETADQQKAIDDTKSDMESERIMDRLVCGDVGFGKTEVAIRAAFKAVQDNMQVAYLVPTTILAEQQYNNFSERMKDYPVNIRMMSRFCTQKEIKQTVKELENGSVDIVIGTHRILSKDVKFKKLGLLIIDEEQRFGVRHKEQIKQMKKNVDVLTLTATPIPRTLHMSMIGLRDISLLEEPPVDRLPIQTYIMEYDIEFVKEAVNRELNRNGQVYYVYNRVNTIEDITLQLRAVLPKAKIEFAHGKMTPREIEDIMRAFINKEIDVLVSTTIIETGLDIPNVNTIIIHDADKFGLSQLYQLRGRVGRSSRSAYAFLLYERDKIIKEVAEKRLNAIREFTELGSGYKISMKDLEIRGAGNLLGQEQSGNIEAVGYDLYCKMLNDAIKRLQGQSIEEEYVTSIELPLDAYIPDTYVKNEYLKLDLYKRISKCESREDNDAIIEEVRDRFGVPPKPFLRLLDVAYLKAIAHKAHMTDVKYVGGFMKFVMLPKAPVDVKKMEKLLKRHKGKLRFVTEKEPVFSILVPKTIQEELIEKAEQLIMEISAIMED